MGKIEENKEEETKMKEEIQNQLKETTELITKTEEYSTQNISFNISKDPS